MYNANKPNPDELPTSGQLVRSTIIAALVAIAILVTIVLPAEYGIDPTRIGRLIGLAEMGEIKMQLSEEAEADRRRERQSPPAASEDDQSSLLEALPGLFVSTAEAQTQDQTRDRTQEPWTDRLSVTLEPSEGAEVKLAMEKGAVAEFRWTVEGGVVNYDLHGDGGGQKITYGRGRAVPGHEGRVKAAFAGNHGWFWRNRDKQDVTVTLHVRGDYQQVKRTD